MFQRLDGGQGVVLKVKMAYRIQSVLSLGIAAKPKSIPQAMVTYETTPKSNPIYTWLPLANDVKSGRLCIRREKEKATFSFKPTNSAGESSEIIFKEMIVPVADVTSFEIVSPRMKTGNTRTQFKMTEIYVKGESHDGLRGPPSRLSSVILYWGPPMVVVLFAAMAWGISQRRRGKNVDQVAVASQDDNV